MFDKPDKNLLHYQKDNQRNKIYQINLFWINKKKQKVVVCLLENNFKKLRFIIPFSVESCSDVFNNIQNEHNHGENAHPVMTNCRLLAEDTYIHEYLDCQDDKENTIESYCC